MCMVYYFCGAHLTPMAPHALVSVRVIHQYIKFELNTECVFCGGPGERYHLLDAIAKFELNPYFNVRAWAARS